MRALAPAKVNVWLEVLGRRADGFHELDTVMVALELCDEVRARRTATGAVDLRVTGPAASADVPTDERNLAVRAAWVALELAREAGVCDARAGLELVLDKHVPSQSGLGGASSDAAAALLAGAKALGLEPSALGAAARERLAALGSDCAFFLEAATGAARCTGRGERVEPLTALEPAWHVALVVPAVVSPTAAVYRALEPADFGNRPPPDLASRALPLHQPFNRLEAAALRAVPELAAWRTLLDDATPGAFCLSGSGSSFFALASDPDDARRLLDAVLLAAGERGLATRGTWALRTRASAAALAPASP